ncbi:hypothetical protein [Amycolatopsis sp. lyj-109]|uniref:hypothetical protein n=1 Tax=Amycolatopsis sp. lyj-109 TaxID=2789287 RepID=UPI00397E7D1B
MSGFGRTLTAPARVTAQPSRTTCRRPITTRKGDPEPPGHHLGRPYATVYQLAIALHTRYPEVAYEPGFEIGGADTGRHNSLAQYLGQQLSTRIARDGDASAIEGAFLSSDHMTNLEFVDAHGGHHASSLRSARRRALPNAPSKQREDFGDCAAVGPTRRASAPGSRLVMSPLA